MQSAQQIFSHGFGQNWSEGGTQKFWMDDGGDTH